MIEDKTKEPQTAEPAQQPPKKRGQKLRSLWAQFQCMQLLRRHRFRRRTQHHVNHFSQKLLQNRLVLIVGEALYALGFSAEYAFVRVGRTVCRGVSGALLWVRSLLHTIVSMAFPGAAQMVRDLFGPIVLFFRGMGSLLVASILALVVGGAIAMGLWQFTLMALVMPVLAGAAYAAWRQMLGEASAAPGGSVAPTRIEV